MKEWIVKTYTAGLMQDLYLKPTLGGRGGVCVFRGFFHIGYNEIEYLVLWCDLILK